MNNKHKPGNMAVLVQAKHKGMKTFLKEYSNFNADLQLTKKFISSEIDEVLFDLVFYSNGKCFASCIHFCSDLGLTCTRTKMRYRNNSFDTFFKTHNISYEIE